MSKNRLIAILTSTILIGGMIGCTTFSNQKILNNNTTKIVNKVLLAAPSLKNLAVVINTGKNPLVLYSSANSNSEISSYISVGEMLNYQKTDNPNFYKVTVQETGATGYISAANIQIIESGVNEVYTSINKSGVIINVSNDVKLMSNPNVNSQVLGSYKNNTNMNILGKQGQWYKVEAGTQVGYMYQSYVGITTEDVAGQVNINSNIKSNSQNNVQVDSVNSPDYLGALDVKSTTFSKYLGTWMPTKVVGTSGDFTTNVPLTQSQLNSKKLILTKDLYSYNGVTIKNPKYYEMTYNTLPAFGCMSLGAYDIKGMGKQYTLIIALPSNEKFNPKNYDSLDIKGLPTITNGNIISFIGNQGQVYQYNKIK